MDCLMTSTRPVSTAEGTAVDAGSRDLILVDRCQAGDQEASEALFHAYYPKVLAIANGVLLNLEEAEDTVQEVFALVFRNLEKFDRRSKFSTWLFRVAVNRSIQESRKFRRRRTAVDIDLISEHPSPAEEENPLAGPVAGVLAELPPSDRAILALFYWEELSIAEIAGSMGCRENAAKTRLYRARERFRQIYEQMECDV